MAACISDESLRERGTLASASGELCGVMMSQTCCRRWLPPRHGCVLCFHAAMLSFTTGASLGALLCCSLTHVLCPPLPQ